MAIEGRRGSGMDWEVTTGIYTLRCLVAKSCPTLWRTPWTEAQQAPLSTGFPRQEYWSGLPPVQPRDWTHVSCIDRQILYHCATWDLQYIFMSEWEAENSQPSTLRQQAESKPWGIFEMFSVRRILTQRFYF